MLNFSRWKIISISGACLLGLLPPVFSIDASDINIGNNNIQATLTALQTFGDVSVMSSPKVMAKGKRN